MVRYTSNGTLHRTVRQVQKLARRSVASFSRLPDLTLLLSESRGAEAVQPFLRLTDRFCRQMEDDLPDLAKMVAVEVRRVAEIRLTNPSHVARLVGHNEDILAATAPQRAIPEEEAYDFQGSWCRWREGRLRCQGLDRLGYPCGAAQVEIQDFGASTCLVLNFWDRHVDPDHSGSALPLLSHSVEIVRNGCSPKYHVSRSVGEAMARMSVYVGEASAPMEEPSYNNPLGDLDDDDVLTDQRNRLEIWLQRARSLADFKEVAYYQREWTLGEEMPAELLMYPEVSR